MSTAYKNFKKYESAKQILDSGETEKALASLEKSPKYVRMWLYSDIFSKSGIILSYNGNMKTVFLSVRDKRVFKVKPGVVELRNFRKKFEDIVLNYQSIIDEILDVSKDW